MNFCTFLGLNKHVDMKITVLISSVLFLVGVTTLAQQQNIAERLGHSADAKLLIIHADDLGVTHSENMASIKGLEESPVNSASIMVPCPWFPEIAAYAKAHKETDFGLHLTLNSEWKYYRWGPVTSKDSVATLIDGDGYLYPLIPGVVNNASPEHVEIEIRNQVKRAYEYGINVTHLDAHMGTAITTPEFMAAYIKVGREFRLPVLLDNQMPSLTDDTIQAMLIATDIVVDHTYTAVPSDFEKGMANYYTEVISNLKPGLNNILIHLAYDNEEMKGVTVDHPNWGAKWRQDDFDFFTSAECKSLLKENNIVLVTWKELRDTIVRGK